MKQPIRFYRDFTDTDRWTAYRVKVDTTDLFIRSKVDLSSMAEAAVRRIRGDLWRHIEEIPDFLTSLSPLPVPEDCPGAAAAMYRAGTAAGVGPMAAVAGTIAGMVGIELAEHSPEVIVENGGDIWLRAERPVEVSVYAGEFRFAGKLRVMIHPGSTPCGICTSSATMGHSLSFGKADAVTVIAGDAALADALATACCNMIQACDDIPVALEYAMDHGASGIIAILYDSMGIKGNIELAG